MPSKTGLDRVSGVMVVLNPSPTVIAVWNWPVELEETMTRLNQLRKVGSLKMPLPNSRGYSWFQLYTFQPLTM